MPNAVEEGALRDADAAKVAGQGPFYCLVQAVQRLTVIFCYYTWK